MASLQFAVYGLVFLCLGYLTVNDYTHTEASAERPAMKMSHHFAGPTLKFMYCISWGYRNVFEDYSARLRHRYPELQIEGGNFPPPTINNYIAKFLGVTKLLLIAMVVTGINPFTALNMDVPGVVTWAYENKIYACLMLFFISNAIETQLLSTGAFEISLNDMPIWSKLESGKVPRLNELIQILENNMKMAYQPSSPR